MASTSRCSGATADITAAWIAARRPAGRTGDAVAVAADHDDEEAGDNDND